MANISYEISVTNTRSYELASQNRHVILKSEKMHKQQKNIIILSFNQSYNHCNTHIPQKKKKVITRICEF